MITCKCPNCGKAIEVTVRVNRVEVEPAPFKEVEVTKADQNRIKGETIKLLPYERACVRLREGIRFCKSLMNRKDYGLKESHAMYKRLRKHHE